MVIFSILAIKSEEMHHILAPGYMSFTLMLAREEACSTRSCARLFSIRAMSHKTK